MLGDFAAAQAVFLLGQHDDRASFRRFVGKAGELSGIRQFAFAHSVDRYEFDRLPIAQSDGSGLVQKQRVHIAGSLHRLSAHGQNVMLHHAIHAGDANRGKQSADGRRNQAHEQGDENGNGRGSAAADGLDGIFRIGRQRRNRQQEDQRQTGDQNVEGDFVGRLLANRAFDEGDHAVQERFTRIGSDSDLDVVRQNLRTAGHRAAVAAGFANDGGALSGDDGFVDAGDALDDFAISRNEIAGFAVHDISGAQLRRRYHFKLVIGQNLARDRVGLGLAQGVGLRFAARFRHGFREIGEHHGKPQPKGDLNAKRRRRRRP